MPAPDAGAIPTQRLRRKSSRMARQMRLMRACLAGAERSKEQARGARAGHVGQCGAEQCRPSLAASRATQCACASRSGVAGCDGRVVRAATCGERRAARSACRSRDCLGKRTGCGRRGAGKRARVRARPRHAAPAAGDAWNALRRAREAVVRRLCPSPRQIAFLLRSCRSRGICAPCDAVHAAAMRAASAAACFAVRP